MTYIKSNHYIVFLASIILDIFFLCSSYINISAFLIILVYIASIYVFTNVNRKNIKVIFAIIITIFSFGLISHKLPGFNNILIYDKVKLDAYSVPYSLYINFDKIWLLMLFIPYLSQNRVPKSFLKSLKYSLLISLSTIIALLIPAYLLGYLKFSLKIPFILNYWLILNLLTVIIEEIFFRGFLQKSIEVYYPNSSLIITSIIFALCHYQGGIPYMSLTFLAGIFYGLAFKSTNRITSSIFVHFLVNLTHILFFTYPALSVH